jgi:hypothetical protein
MTVYPLVPQPVRKVGHYPHMARRDVSLWERFLDAFGGDFDSFAYDVALGGLEPADPGIPEAERRGWRYATAAKIDAVGFRPDEVWIIEVKPNASFSALGQLLAYSLLAEREPFTRLPLLAVLVTDNATPDMLYVAGQLGIPVYQVAEPEPERPP